MNSRRSIRGCAKDRKVNFCYIFQGKVIPWIFRFQRIYDLKDAGEMWKVQKVGKKQKMRWC
jgi:hypothetical protein